MLKFTRREFLGSAVAATFCSRMDFAKEEKLRIGVTDWNLNLGASPEAVPLAAKLAFRWGTDVFRAKARGWQDAHGQSGSDCPLPQSFQAI